MWFGSRYFQSLRVLVCVHSEAGLTYLRAAAVKLEPAEKEDFDMMMLMLSNLMMTMLMLLKPDDEYARLELDDDNALNVGLKPGCKYDAALLLMKILCST